METINVELYFDLRSHRARVTWGREDRILRDTFPNREAAEAAAACHDPQNTFEQYRNSNQP